MLDVVLLVVEDCTMVRDRFIELVSAEGIDARFVEASTRADALLALAREPINMLVVDLVLPDGSGIDVVEFAKKQSPTRMAVVLTSLATDVARTLCARRGADQVFDKLNEFERCAKHVAQVGRDRRWSHGG